MQVWAWAVVDERVWIFLRVAVSVTSESIRRHFRRLGIRLEMRRREAEGEVRTGRLGGKRKFMLVGERVAKSNVRK